MEASPKNLKAVKTMQETSVFELIHDRDGLVWQVVMTKRLAPATKRADKIVWHVQLHAETAVKGAHLVGTGTLDGRRDARLIELLGPEAVRLRTGGIRFEAVDERQIPGSAVEGVVGLKKSLLSMDVTDLKRRAVAETVDRICAFT